MEIEQTIEEVARYIAKRVTRSPSTQDKKIGIVRQVLKQWREAEVVAGYKEIKVVKDTCRACMVYLVGVPSATRCRGCPFASRPDHDCWRLIERLTSDGLCRLSLCEAGFVKYRCSNPRERIVQCLERVLELVEAESGSIKKRA